MRITARQTPLESGLAGVCQGPRGFIIKVDGRDVGRVACHLRDGGLWFFYVGDEALGIPRLNTVVAGMTFYPSKDAAKQACIDYIKNALNA